jgi:acyl CoA:acetate/3-ketoacid CoA transferase beta subunit
MNSKEIISRRAALELEDGQVVNLGFGMPTAVSNYVPEGVEVISNPKMDACYLVRRQN